MLVSLLGIPNALNKAVGGTAVMNEPRGLMRSRLLESRRAAVATEPTEGQLLVQRAEPEEHSAGCEFTAGLVPGRNVARGLDPDNCERCRALVALLDEAAARRQAKQQLPADRWGRPLTEQPQARPGESPAAFTSRMLGGRDV